MSGYISLEDDGYGRQRYGRRMRRDYTLWGLPPIPTSSPYLLILPLKEETGEYSTEQYNTTWYGHMIQMNQCRTFAEEASRLNRGTMVALGTRRTVLRYLFITVMLLLALDLFFWLVYVTAPVGDRIHTGIPFGITFAIAVVLVVVTICLRSSTIAECKDSVTKLKHFAHRENDRRGLSGYWEVGALGRWLEFHIVVQGIIPGNNYTTVDASGMPIAVNVDDNNVNNPNYYNPQYFSPDSQVATNSQMNRIQQSSGIASDGYNTNGGDPSINP